MYFFSASNDTNPFEIYNLQTRLKIETSSEGLGAHLGQNRGTLI